MSQISEDIMSIGKTVAQRIPFGLLTRLEEVEKKEHFDNRTDTINAIIEIGLIAYEHKSILKDEHLKEEIQKQLREGGVVDYFRKLSSQDLEVLHSIIKTEVRDRKGMLKK